MDYEQTVKALFDLLSLANRADHETKEPWQLADDCKTAGFYGKIRAAIVEIAGDKIVNYWEGSGEIQMKYASRR